MCDQSQEEAEAVRCLLSWSSSCYSSLLDGPPPQNNAAGGSAPLSRWENVRPGAEYDLTESGRVKRRKRRPSNQLLARGAVSLPNLRTQKSPYPKSYMSGHLDENFSYVYPGGLSSRATSSQSEYNRDTQVNYLKDPLLYQQAAGSRSYSTHTLTLNTCAPSIFAQRQAAQMDTKIRREISTLVAMQLRPEVLAEQIVMENRLRNLELSTFPVLGAKSDSRLTVAERGNGAHWTQIKSESAPSVAVHGAPWQTQQFHNKKSLRSRRTTKSKSKSTTFKWCPMAIQECSSSSTEFRLSSYKDSGFSKTGGAMSHHKNSVTNVGGSNTSASVESNRNGLSGLLGVGSLSLKKTVNASESTKIGENEEKLSSQSNLEKSVSDRRTVSYFGQERFAVENSAPESNLNEQTVPYRMRVPVVVPSLSLTNGQGLRTGKRFNSRLETFHHSGAV